jgi:coenzyme F420-reducing hydrogenase beta subunit
MDISGGKFILKEKNGEESKVPLKEVTPFAREQCHFCSDLTSEFADISVGSIGSNAGWSSVITRTKTGDDLFNKLLQDELVEIKELEKFGLVKKISASKSTKCKTIEFNKLKMEKNKKL